MYGVDIKEILESPATKLGFATRMVLKEAMASVVPLEGEPQVGDLVLTRIKSIGRHKRVEVQEGYNMDLFVGDYLIGSFGNRYATDQFEGYVPPGPVEECDLYSAGAVVGEMASRHASMATPTRLEVIGAVADADGNPLNQRDFGLVSDSPLLEVDEAGKGEPETILVIGSSMDSGKTTTAGTIVRSLSRSGYRVAAAKVTGTATGKDCRFFESNGASPVYDFISAGYPSTYMIEDWELMKVYSSILRNLKASGPDYIVLEIADGVFQRETKMLLESDLVRDSVDHVFFAAGDALAVAYGVNAVRSLGLPLRATSGAVTAGELGVRESEELSDLPCMSLKRLLSEELLDVLRLEVACDIRAYREQRSFSSGSVENVRVSA